jgi:hypothetical protein
MGIVGLPNVGKSTMFNTMTKLSIPAENFPFCTIDPNNARVTVPDARFDWLVGGGRAGGGEGRGGREGGGVVGRAALGHWAPTAAAGAGAGWLGEEEERARAGRSRAGRALPVVACCAPAQGLAPDAFSPLRPGVRGSRCCRWRRCSPSPASQPTWKCATLRGL